MRAPARVAAAALLGLLAGCQEHRFEPPDRGARVLAADSAFALLNFDTIAWEDGDSARAFFGNEVYARKCRDCHGFMGRGDTEYGRERAVAPPSLVRAAWPPGDSVPQLRRRIFTGHPAGMPTFGVGNLSLREVDAVAFYIAHRLRPEVLDTATAR